MIGWEIRTASGELVTTIYYREGCDEAYIRRAEEIPDEHTMTKEA